MTNKEFCATHPNLYHMASAASLEQTKKYGLLSTNAILDLIGADLEQRRILTTQRRPELVTLDHAQHGQFVLRDQKPLRDAALDQCLEDMTREQWYKTLNSRVFMWASPERVESLVKARAYKKHHQLLLTIDSESFLKKHFDIISVSTINSGATLYKPVKRGAGTFVSIHQFLPSESKRKIVEITADHLIGDFRDFIVHSEIRKAQAK